MDFNASGTKSVKVAASESLELSLLGKSELKKARFDQLSLLAKRTYYRMFQDRGQFYVAKCQVMGMILLSLTFSAELSCGI